MYKHEAVAYLMEHGIVAIIRADSGGEDLVCVAEAIAAGGIHCIEITMNTPGALEAIAEAAKRLDGQDVLLGAGTVLDPESCRLAILAGARFIVTPDALPPRPCGWPGVTAWQRVAGHTPPLRS